MNDHDWTQQRRETGLVEHICEHGMGHPNWGSALWCAERYGEADSDDVRPRTLEEVHSAWLVHGCDGCCGSEDFPGTPFRSMIYAHKLIRAMRTLIVEE